MPGAGTANHDVDVDVAIVGYGPVGQALAALLGRAGHRVTAFERFAEIYRLPRAVHLDHEIMRLLQALGLAEALADEMVPVNEYQWFGADGEPLLRFQLAEPGAVGLGPELHVLPARARAGIDGRACAQPGVTVERGWVAEGWSRPSGVELTVRRVTEEEQGLLTRAAKPAPFARAGSWVPTAPTRSSARRAASPVATSASRSAGWWSTPSRTTWLPCAHLPIACQWCDPSAPDDVRPERPPAPALGVHAAARRGAGRLRGSGPGVVAARAVVPARGRPADAQRRLRVPLHARRRMRTGRVLARRRRRPPDPAVPRSGAVLRPARCRQRRLEARPRPARPVRRRAAGQRSIPSASRRTRRSSAWPSSSARSSASSTRRRPPSATRCCARPTAAPARAAAAQRRACSTPRRRRSARGDPQRPGPGRPGRSRGPVRRRRRPRLSADRRRRRSARGLSPQARAALDTLDMTVASLDGGPTRRARPRRSPDRLARGARRPRGARAPRLLRLRQRRPPQRLPALLDDLRSRLYLTSTPTSSGALA